MLPLTNIRVVDFSTLLPGPLATLLLSEAGADVVKVERPGGGDEMRSYVPRIGTASANFALLNRGKRSVQLDLKDPAQRGEALALIEEADVVVEQFRPGVMRRLGLDYAAVSQLNPRVIYCSITGYGPTGPYADRAGHDLNYQAATGMLDLAGARDGSPVLPAALLADIGAGAYPAVMNILLALLRRTATGGGEDLQITMADNLFPYLYWGLAQGWATGEWPARSRGLVTGGSPRYALYETSDGQHLAAAPLEDRFWSTFCEMIDLAPELRDDAVDPDATRQAVAALIADRTADEWTAVFGSHDVCCTMVRSLEDACRDEAFEALFSRRVRSPDGASIPALPVPIVPRLSRTERELDYPPLEQLNATWKGLAHARNGA